MTHVICVGRLWSVYALGCVFLGKGGERSEPLGLLGSAEA